MKPDNTKPTIGEWLFFATLLVDTFNPIVEYFYSNNSFMQCFIFIISLTLLILSIYFSKSRRTKKWKYALKNMVSKTIFQLFYICISLFGIAISLLFGSSDWIHWAIFGIAYALLIAYFHFRDKE